MTATLRLHQTEETIVAEFLKRFEGFLNGDWKSLLISPTIPISQKYDWVERELLKVVDVDSSFRKTFEFLMQQRAVLLREEHIEKERIYIEQQQRQLLLREIYNQLPPGSTVFLGHDGQLYYIEPPQQVSVFSNDNICRTPDCRDDSVAHCQSKQHICNDGSNCRILSRGEDTRHIRKYSHPITPSGTVSFRTTELPAVCPDHDVGECKLKDDVHLRRYSHPATVCPDRAFFSPCALATGQLMLFVCLLSCCLFVLSLQLARAISQRATRSIAPSSATGSRMLGSHNRCPPPRPLPWHPQRSRSRWAPCNKKNRSTVTMCV